MATRHIEIQTQALLQSLFLCPPLVLDLPEAPSLDRNLLGKPQQEAVLNYSQKLGHLYEDALTILLESSDKLNLIASSVQIFNENQITLGELDYLLENKSTGKHIHLELAVKFYLIHHIDGEAHFPGPDPRDNWLNKLKRMQQHQFQMARSEHGGKLLEEKYAITDIETQQLIYGRIFDHIAATDFPTPPHMNADCLRSLWLYCHEWDTYFQDIENVKIIPKHLWPVSFKINPNLTDTLEEWSKDDLLTEAQQRCTLIWSEQHQRPVFLTPDRWPEFK